MKIIQILLCVLVLLPNSLIIIASPINDEINEELIKIDDYDPLLDIKINISIKTIRAFDLIDDSSDPDFFVRILIFNEEFVSPIWCNTSCLYECWYLDLNIPDDYEVVNITFELWDWSPLGNRLCDISENINENGKGYDVKIYYNIKTGQWSGDDGFVNDSSGYGRLNGCDDGSIYQQDRDCELWFDIYQNDYDGDGIPYWAEVFYYGTDPEIDNTGEDKDGDGCSIEWEHKWGFNPFVWEDHLNLDLDKDSINNFEEFLTKRFGSDPFRKDLFLEI